MAKKRCSLGIGAWIFLGTWALVIETSPSLCHCCSSVLTGNPMESFPKKKMSTPRKPGRWRRRLVWGTGTLAVLLLLSWVVLTSNWFLRAVLLPKVNHALNATVEFENAKWSFGSQLQLEGVTLQAIGERPLLKASRVEINYQWRDLFAGRMEFGKIECDEPELFLHIDRNGQANYAPLLERPRSDHPRKPLRIKQIAINGARVEYRCDHQSGTTETAQLSGVNITSGEFAAGQPGELTVNGRAGYSLKPLQQPGQGLAGEFQLKFTHQLDEHLFPTRLKSKGHFQVALATGQFAFATGLNTELDTEATAKALQRFALHFTHAGTALGKLEASGALQPGAGAANLTVTLHGVNQRVLNFLGRPVGLDFHSTVLDSTNHVRVAGFGKTLEVRGTLQAQPFHLSSSGFTTPPLERGGGEYAFAIDTAARTARLDSLALNATHEGTPLLVGHLDRPMQFDWSTRTAPLGESLFSLSAQDINLADWPSLLGQYAMEGHVAAGVKIHFQEAGRRIDFALAAEGAGLRLQKGDPILLPASLRADGTLQDFRQLTLSKYSLRLGSTNAPAFNAFGSNVQCDLRERTASGETTVRADLARVRPWISKAPNSLSGTLDFNGTMTAGLRAPQFQSVKGQLHLENFNFRAGQHRITNLFTRANVDLRLDGGHRLKVNSLGARVALRGYEIAPHLTAKGDWDLRSGHLNFQEIVLKDFRLARFATQTGTTQFTNGVLAATVSVNHIPDRHTQVNGQATFTDIRQPGWRAPVTFSASGKLTLDESRTARWPVSVAGLRVEFPRDDVLDGELQLNGGWHPHTGTAAFTLEDAELDHRLLAPWLVDLGGALTWSGGKLKGIGKTEVNLDGHGGGTVRGMVHASGVLAEAQDFDWPKAPMNAELYLDFSRTIPQGGRPVNTVRDANLKVMLPDKTAARLRFSGQHHPGINRWRVVFQPPAEKEKSFINHHLLQPLLGKQLAPRKLTQGVLQLPGKLEITSDGQGGFQMKGDVELASVRMDDPSKQWPDKILSATASLDLTRQAVPGTDEWRLRSNGTRGFIFINNKHSGTFSVKGDFNPFRSHGNLELDCRDLDQLALAPVSDLLGGPAFKTVRVKMLKGSVRIDGAGSGQVEALLHVDRVRLRGDLERAPARALLLNFKGGVTNHVYHFDNCAATLTATNAFTGESSLNVTGSLNFTRRDAPSGHLKVSSKSLDITALEEMFEQFSRPKPAAPPAAPIAPIVPAVTRSVFQNLRWDFDVKEMRWFGLTGTNVIGTIVRDGRKVRLEPLEMKLFGAPVMAEGWFEPQGNRTRYAMNFACEQLPLNQLNDYFKIKRAHNYGLLDTRFHVAANALNGPEFQKSFLLRGIESGRARFTTTKAHWAFFRDGKMPRPNVIPSAVTSIIQFVPGLSLPMDQVSGALGKFASLLGDKELGASHLDQGQLLVSVKNGLISHDFTVAGPLVRANIQGDFKLADNWDKSLINEKLTIEFAPNFANKYSPTAIVFPKNKFVKIPPCLSISGPLNNVTFKPNDLGLSLMAGGQLTAAPGRLFRKLPIPLLNMEEDMVVNPLGLLRWLIPGGDKD